MNDKEFAQMMQELIKDEERRLQVGSPSFIRRDKEINYGNDRTGRGKEGVREWREQNEQIIKVVY